MYASLDIIYLKVDTRIIIGYIQCAPLKISMTFEKKFFFEARQGVFIRDRAANFKVNIYLYVAVEFLDRVNSTRLASVFRKITHITPTYVVKGITSFRIWSNLFPNNGSFFWEVYLAKKIKHIYLLRPCFTRCFLHNQTPVDPPTPVCYQ